MEAGDGKRKRGTGRKERGGRRSQSGDWKRRLWGRPTEDIVFGVEYEYYKLRKKITA